MPLPSTDERPAFEPSDLAARRVVILNPASGGADDDLRGTVEAAFTEANLPCEWRETTAEHDAGAIAREAAAEGVQEIVVCGGDGSVMAAINGLGANADVALGIVPTGTANLIAAGLGLPTDPAEAARVAIDGGVRTIDLGRCGETLFALGVGLGLTERFVTRTPSGVKAVFGKGAYLWSLIRELGARPNRFTLTLDDDRVIEEEGVALVIANIGSLGGHLRFAPDARSDDGVLDVCILRRFGVGDALRLLGSLLRHDLEHDRALAFFRASRLEFDAAPPLAVQIDGDAVEMTTPIVAEILPLALRVHTPTPDDAGV